MKLSLAARVAIVGTACAAAAIPVMALAGSGQIGRLRASAVPACTAQSTTTWLGLGSGGGTLGTTFYPVEFSNTGRVACSLFGYPVIFAVSAAGRQLGLPSSAHGRRQLVVLEPGQTAHVVLGITGAGVLSGCELRKGAFLKVVAPGQSTPTYIPNFTFTACANKSVLEVDAVHPRAGIPGFTPS